MTIISASLCLQKRRIYFPLITIKMKRRGNISFLINYLSQFCTITERLEKELAELVELKSFKKNEQILSIGSTCQYLYFVVKGFAKGTRIFNHKIETSWFWKELDVMTSIDSFLRQSPSEEGILAIEDCVVFQLSYTDLQHLYKEFIEFNIVGRKIIEFYFLKSGEITTALRSMNAEQKYNYLLRLHPDIFQRTTLQNISSYLGLSPETVSRIRRKPLIS